MTEFYKNVGNADTVGDIRTLLIELFELFNIERFFAVTSPARSLNDPSAMRFYHHGYDDALEIPNSTIEVLSRPNKVAALRRTITAYAGPFYGLDFFASQVLDEGEPSPHTYTQSASKMGLVIPLIGPQLYIGCIIIAANPEDLTPSQVRKVQANCYALFQRYCEIWHENHDRSISLNTREAEVLQWLTMGKSNDVIGTLIGVSKHTVDAYIRRIFKKLSVHDRVSAAVKSSEMGLLSKVYNPDDKNAPIYSSLATQSRNGDDPRINNI